MEILYTNFTSAPKSIGKIEPFKVENSILSTREGKNHLEVKFLLNGLEKYFGVFGPPFQFSSQSQNICVFYNRLNIKDYLRKPSAEPPMGKEDLEK